MTSLIPNDAEVRKQALDTGASFAISAPAGSGKTGLLTQRILALLAQCEQPENCLAITFTRKAAGEMQTRIMAALRHARETPEPPTDSYERETWALARAVVERDQNQQWQLFALPNRLRITTIDGLCRQLSQQMPLESGLGAIPEMLDNPRIAYELAVRETLKLLEKDNPISPHLSRLIRHLNNRLEYLEQLLMQLLAKRDQWMGVIFASKNQRHTLEAILTDVVNEHLEQLHHKLSPIGSELALLLDYAACQLQHDHSDSIITGLAAIDGLPEPDYHHQQQWQAVATALLTDSGQWRKSVTKRVGFPTEALGTGLDKKAAKQLATERKQAFNALLEHCKSIAELEPALAAVNDLPKVHYGDQQWELLESLTIVLPVLCSQLRLTFQQLGKADYIEVTQAALQALGDADQPTELALKLDYRIQHILVDEFQDTSSPQLELLSRLTSGWQNGDGRTLFLVGDAMQSCYSFRDANVGIFLNCRQHGIGDIALTPLDLTVNFRSYGPVVEWVNQHFTDIFPNQDNSQLGAVSYRQAVAFQANTAADNDAPSPVCTWVFAVRQKPSKREHEAAKVIDIIQRSRRQQPDATVAILVRSRAHIRDIVAQLQYQSILYQANDIDALASRMPVIDLMSLTRAMLYPFDRIAWLALLRAPWCGLDMHDLYALAKATLSKDGQQTQHWPLLIEQVLASATAELSEQGAQILQRFSRAIAKAFAQRKRKSLRSWIEGLWLALGGPGLLLNDNDGDNLTTFFELLDAHDHGGHIDQWVHFQQAVDQLFAKPAQHGHNPVQVMTIHKSKGLEFDTVIIPGLDKQPRPNDSELLLWLERLPQNSSTQTYHQLLISPISPSGADKDSIYQFIQKQQQQRLRLEADRLLYVGCTRAISHLHLLGYATTTTQDAEETSVTVDQLKTPSKNSLLASLWPHLEDEANIIAIEPDEQQPPEGNTSLAHPNIILRQQPDWQPPAIPASSLLAPYYSHKQTSLNSSLTDESSDKESALEPDDNIARPDQLQQRYSRYVGTVVHQSLQTITETGLTSWDASRLEKQLTFWDIQLQQLGMNRAERIKACKKIKTATNNTLADTKGRWLLDHTHEQSACELSLWLDKNGHYFEYVIDRTFIVENEGSRTRWIIDYKTSEPSTEQTLDDFIAEEVTTYRDQLENYRALFLGEETTVRLALYFPLLQLFTEL